MSETPLMSPLFLINVFQQTHLNHYSDVIMGAMASQITNIAIVYSTVNPGAAQRNHQSSASLAFVWGIHRWPVNSPHKWPVTQKMFPFDGVIMIMEIWIHKSGGHAQCVFFSIEILNRHSDTFRCLLINLHISCQRQKTETSWYSLNHGADISSNKLFLLVVFHWSNLFASYVMNALKKYR